jgi:signal transduction histidine kinase
MKATGEYEKAIAGPLSEKTPLCPCAPVPSESMPSVYGKFVLLTSSVGSAGKLEVSGCEPEMANQVLRQRIAELEAKNRDLEAFAHTVAHDLKGPICNLAGYADLVRRAHTDMLDDELQKCLSMVHRSALKLNDIIDELLLLAELRQDEVEIEELDMADIVSRALSRLSYKLDGDATSVVLPDTWPTAVGYGPWVEEVWVNYIDNALKYGGRPARVELGAERVDGASRFWVRDNGRGLTATEQDQLFSPFTRLAKAYAEGHGLGLSVVYHIVEKLGGRVGVDSVGVLGQGSVFSFTLPAGTQI